MTVDDRVYTFQQLKDKLDSKKSREIKLTNNTIAHYIYAKSNAGFVKFYQGLEGLVKF